MLARLATDAEAADLQPEAELRFEGKKYNWPVVRAVTKERPGRSRDLIQMTMDPATLRIGRLVWSQLSQPQDEKTVLQLQVNFKMFRIGEPIPESTFAFEPPKKAKLVEAVPIPGQTGSFLLNRPARDFELKTLDGETVRLFDLRGRPVLLNFWASWCAPCSVELPELEKLYAEYKDKGLAVFGINTEGKHEARAYANKAGLTFPTLDDSRRKASRAFRVRAIPSVFVIGPDGKVVRYFRGARTLEQLREALKGVGL